MPFLPTIFTVMGVGILLWILYWLLIGRHHDVGKERKFPRQIILLGVMLAGILVTILVLPISESSRNQLIGLIGLLISGIVAFSSTNIISNFMAGILLRITTPFRTGDFVRVGDHFGRVSERGLFDTEIQTETRELVALPNTYLTNNPVTTIRSSGTIISVSLSLGYDVHHCQVESLLIKAAEKCGLEEPFVHILDMANYSVTYRVSGLLMDVKKIISVRSNLFQCVLDTLHDGGIEIASPTIMNQRQIEKDRKIMPMAMHTTSTNVNVNAEEIAFDKAELAEQMENEKEKLTQTIQELEAELKNASENDKIRIKEKIKKCSERLNHLNTDKVETISAQK
ncbi:MAG: mechanosensitive ion channel [Deltaproteobacteria bacterium]|nr:mechanosensitive ion channel [Deltaproteobacteria bacterium]